MSSVERRLQLVVVAVVLGHQAGVVLDDVGGFLDLTDRLQARLAGFGRQDGAELGDSGRDAICRLQKTAATLFDGGPAPCLEGVAGRGDGFGDEFGRRRVGSGDAHWGGTDRTART